MTEKENVARVDGLSTIHQHSELPRRATGPSERPRRIQRRRTKGWRMPENTVYVGRPTIYGNPFTPEKYYAAGYSGSLQLAMKYCVEAFSAYMLSQPHWAHGGDDGYPPPLEPLRGKDLACWCPLDQPCHADVLLELANVD